MCIFLDPAGIRLIIMGSEIVHIKDETQIASNQVPLELAAVAIAKEHRAASGGEMGLLKSA